MNESIRNLYSQLGVDNYYSSVGNDYLNPHEKIISNIISKLYQDRLINGKILDLCCGSGEVTKHLTSKDIIGLDPYMYKVYREQTRKNCYEYDFHDIAMGRLKEKFDTIICSFALHLCPESLLHNLLWRLKEISNTLIVISPNKKPDCDNVSGWILVDEFTINRVRTKIYKS